MARNEVAEKLNALVTKVDLIWDEPNVMYLFVQMRKLLDHLRQDEQMDLPHLRLYCDWLVHISKDRIDSVTLDVISNIETSIRTQISSPYLSMGEAAIDFAYFKTLKAEVNNLLTKEGIGVQLLDEDEWLEIVINLISILIHQPLVVNKRHGTNISRLEFLPAAPRCVIMQIDFFDAVTGRDGTEYPYYTLKNAY
ncbi:hypothetical protein KC959_00020 [Candidatus Saccharibacteria bacterium]|nr:hypothetical protein [Candidatus Saccharibacteria bacterium]